MNNINNLNPTTPAVNPKLDDAPPSPSLKDLSVWQSAISNDTVNSEPSTPSGSSGISNTSSSMAQLAQLIQALQEIITKLTENEVSAEPPQTPMAAPTPPPTSIPGQPDVAETESNTAPSEGAGQATANAGDSNKSDATDDGQARRDARKAGSSEAEQAGQARRDNRDEVDTSTSEGEGGTGTPSGDTASTPVEGVDGSRSPRVERFDDPPRPGREIDGQVVNFGEVKSDGDTMTSFESLDPSHIGGPSIGPDGKFTFKNVVDDSFLPENVRAEMKQAVSANKDLEFFQDFFNTEGEMYQYLVHVANLESGHGKVLDNPHDAQGTGGGSAGYMHLHTTFGLEQQSWGSPLNDQNWSKDEVLNDYSKYTTLVMKSLNNNYRHLGTPNTQEGAAGTMAMWWVGSDKAQAGEYYLAALSEGKGVNHNTGSAYA